MLLRCFPPLELAASQANARHRCLISNSQELGGSTATYCYYWIIYQSNQDSEVEKQTAYEENWVSLEAEYIPFLSLRGNLITWSKNNLCSLFLKRFFPKVPQPLLAWDRYLNKYLGLALLDISDSLFHLSGHMLQLLFCILVNRQP